MVGKNQSILIPSGLSLPILIQFPLLDPYSLNASNLRKYFLVKMFHVKRLNTSSPYVSRETLKQ